MGEPLPELLYGRLSLSVRLEHGDEHPLSALSISGKSDAIGTEGWHEDHGRHGK